MVILRPTQKLKTLLATGRPAPSSSDTALGDWYVNRLVVDRQPLLILVSSASLLPLLVPARDVKGPVAGSCRAETLPAVDRCGNCRR